VNFENRAKRFQQIYQHIMRLAVGDFSSRLSFSDEKDQLETLVLLLNMLTEELSELFYGADTLTLCHSLIGANFLLDSNHTIVFANPETTKLFEVQNNESVIGNSFLELLTPDSQANYKKMLENPIKNIRELKIPVKFNSTKNTISNCELSKVPGIPLTILQINSKSTEKSVRKKEKLYLKEDMEKIRKIREHILANFNEELPGLKELAQMVHTNEYKLKYGFKQLYGTTIFRFQADIRMKQAKILVENTSMPIKQIFNQLGYKSGAHFSRSFKKYYGTNPRKYRKLNS